MDMESPGSCRCHGIVSLLEPARGYCECTGGEGGSSWPWPTNLGTVKESQGMSS